MDSTSRAGPARIIVLGAAIVWAGAASLACKPAGEKGGETSRTPAVDTASPESSRTAAATDTSAPYRPATYRGALPKPIDSLIRNPREFLDLVGPHVWRGHDNVRRDCKACGPAQFTIVDVGAIEDAHTVKHDSLPPNGVIMARLHNHGQRIEAKYGIPPAGVWYVLWGGDGQAVPHMRMVKLVVSGHDTTIALTDVLGRIRDCGDTHADTTLAGPDADFASCRSRLAPRTTPEIATSQRTDGVWLSCSQGCCTADPPQPFPP
jgi:hypothetical protein